MNKQWKIMEWSDECPECGDGVEVFTDCETKNIAYDGDIARCIECHYEGWVGEYDDEKARINWKE